MAILRCGDIDMCERIMMDEFSLMGCDRDRVDRLKDPAVKQKEQGKMEKEGHTTLSRMKMYSA